MLHIPGFSIDAEIYQGPRSTVLRGRSENDGARVILKVHTQSGATPSDLARIQYTHELTTSLDLPGISATQLVSDSEGRPVLVSPDRDARPLRAFLEEQGPNVFMALHLGLAATRVLQRLHEAGVVHRDINPANIIADPQGQVEIIDLEFATRVAHEQNGATAVDRLVGTLAYIAPEQTGRMNREVDQRSDLYSLGVTLYELMTGTLPFKEREPTALVYQHLAVSPQPPHARNPLVPRMLSEVVMRLLAKTPEDRYQSARGLAHDLERCLTALQSGGAIAPFRLGRADISPRFVVSQKLVGRDDEIASLMAAFQRAVQGDAVLLTVGGYSGVGKTALVNEVHRPIAGARGRFASGKFNQYGNVPYAGLIQAIEELVSGVLTDASVPLGVWRGRLQDAVGDLGQLIIDVVPRVELIIGPQPAAPKLPPAEARNRYQLVLQRFLRAFAQPDAPLVLFLDDLQWARPTSFSLLELLVTDPSNRHLLVLGAYRSNEVDAAHPLSATLERLRSGNQLTELALQPLAVEGVEELVATSMRRDRAEVREIARIVHEKTGGNPFFVERLLLDQADAGALQVDAEAAAWSWDSTALARLEVSDNVAKLMAQGIARLPETCQHALACAACVGSRFDLRSLALLLELPPGEAAATLAPALEEDLIRPLNGDHALVAILADDAAVELAGRVVYRFEHDRIQEASYALQSAAQRARLHRSYGRLLDRTVDLTAEPERVFDIVNQLMAGASQIASDEERVHTVRLLLDAGARAAEAAAYPAAKDYLQFGLDLLGDRAWDEHYALARDLTLALGSALDMCGEVDASAALLAAGAERAHGVADQARFLDTLVVVKAHGTDYAGAIRAGLDALALYGFEEPQSPEAWGALLGAEGARIQEQLEGKELLSLVDQPAMTDPDALAQIALLETVCPPAWTQPHVFAFAVMRQVNLTLEYGNAPQSSMAFGFQGVFAAGQGDLHGGYAFGQLARRLNASQQDAAREPMVIQCCASFIDHWTQNIDDVADLSEEGIRLAIEVGNFTFAGWLMMNGMLHHSVAGRDLPSLVRILDRYADVSRVTLKYPDTEYEVRGVAYSMLRLMGDHARLRAMDSEGASADALADKVMHHHFGPYVIYTNDAMASYLLGDLDRAADRIARVPSYAAAAPGQGMIPRFTLFDVLIGVARYPSLDRDAQIELDARLDAHLAKLKTWAEAAPTHHGWKHPLAAAEVARLRGEELTAVDFFDEAIDLAETHRRLHGEALALERAGRFQLARGRRRIGRFYMRAAQETYTRWGAQEKVGQLVDEFPFLTRVQGLDASSVSVSVTATASSSFLDVHTLLKASEAISRIIDLDELLARLLGLAIENAGAQRCRLLLRDGDKMWVEAKLDEPGAAPLLRQHQDPDEDAIVSSVVRYVERSLQAAVVADATLDNRFSLDPDVVQRKPRSILCLPIVNKGNLVGLIYLENNVTSEAFTLGRVAVLESLMSQAAISIENALLYEHQKRLNAAMARFVPSEFLSMLGREGIIDVQLGDSVARDMTVLFSDIRSFTTISAGLTPQENFEFLNGYLREVGPVIRENNGFIDKYIGDAIMALFPGPVDDALAAAQGMHAAVARYNETLEAKGMPPMEIGVGLHTGGLMLGTIGESERIEATVISDVVNTASRLESSTKQYGVGILCSGDVLQRALYPDRWVTRLVDTVVLRGRATETDLHEVAVLGRFDD